VGAEGHHGGHRVSSGRPSSLSHLFGNLKIFQGPEAYNHYAHWLREAFYPLMPKQSVLLAMRAVLGAALLMHVGCAAIIGGVDARPVALTG
jgi:hypothetical protein